MAPLDSTHKKETRDEAPAIASECLYIIDKLYNDNMKMMFLLGQTKNFHSFVLLCFHRSWVSGDLPRYSFLILFFYFYSIQYYQSPTLGIIIAVLLR